MIPGFYPGLKTWAEFPAPHDFPLLSWNSIEAKLPPQMTQHGVLGGHVNWLVGYVASVHSVPATVFCLFFVTFYNPFFLPALMDRAIFLYLKIN